MKKRLAWWAALCLCLLQSRAEVKLPAFFSDGMVLQQQSQANIWGTADPGKSVRVTTSWNNKEYKVKADARGRWKLAVATPEAGGPYRITLSDGQPVELQDVWIGEVWICSGQSNMEMPMMGFKNQPVEHANLDAARGTNPKIRLFTVKRNSSFTLKEDVTGKWAAATPASIREFSATAYYFGRLVNEITDVPIGLIVAAWGGSACEAWMTADMLKAFPDAKIPQRPEDIKSKNRTPTVLYNGMLHPLIGYTMRGVIWYQGEDNWNRAHTYADMFTTMIKGWRTAWGQGDFPFYYCQIAPYDYSLITEKGKVVFNSAYLREAQFRAETMSDNVGMAVLLDAGLKTGIHPHQKQVAGERLGLLALQKTYQVDGIMGESPRYKSMEVRNDTVIVSFDRADMWINAKDFVSKCFKLAGEDQVFHPAEAWIWRSKIYVKSEQVKHPVAVRYAFENYVEGDLFSGDGLPLSSFRSDNWPDVCPIKE